MDAGVADRERWRQSAENMQVLWVSIFPPLSFGLVGLIKVILLHLIIVLQAHPFQFPGPWAEEGGWLRKERRARLPDGCHYRVCAIWQPCLQLFTEANAAPVETARSCRSSNRSAEGFSTHGKRPRSFFKPTPEGSTVLVNALQTAYIVLLFSFFNPVWIFCHFPKFYPPVERPENQHLFKQMLKK